MKVWLPLALGLCTIAACATIKRTIAPLPPADRVTTRGQLVFHTNFDLPAQHRLLDELVAERADVSARLGLPTSDEPIQVYLFQNADQFSAFIRAKYPQFPNRRAFFVETDTQLDVYAYWGDRVGEDMRHEVSHGYMHSIVSNVPLWLDEGLAEYFEAPRAMHGLNRPNLEELADLQRQGKWQPDMVRLEQLPSAGAMGQVDYDEAWAWAYWLLESDAAHRKLLQDYLQLLRKNENPGPLSVFIRRLPGDHHRDLATYVAGLAKQPPGDAEGK